ncbi:MAG: chromate transporter [Clostridia bacterium]|nr:chromate transporter [Clostridia bacterium]
MIYLRLFLVFLEIGAVSFGGGYGMISLIREQVISNGWLTESELLDVIAVAESTPGPIAVNAATFIGSKQAGIPGALCATLGVILPSFIIMLLIAALVQGFLKYKGVQAFLSGVRPCVVALILATATTMALSILFGIKDVSGGTKTDVKAIVILALLGAVTGASKRLFKKKPSPIIMILISAGFGMAAYSLPDF